MSDNNQTAARIEGDSNVLEASAILKDAGHTGLAAALAEQVGYIKGLEERVDSCNKLLSDMKYQLDTIREIQDHPIKSYLDKAVKDLEKDLGQTKGTLGRMKDAVINACKKVVTAFKEQGVLTKDAVVGILGLKEYHQKVEAKACKMIAKCEKTTARVESFSKEFHKGTGAFTNMARVFVGKEPVDKEAEAGKLAKRICEPYRNKIKECSGIRDGARKCIESLDNLKDRADEIRQKRGASKSDAVQEQPTKPEGEKTGPENNTDTVQGQTPEPGSEKATPEKPENTAEASKADETKQESGASRPGQHGDLHSKKEPEVETAVPENTAEASKTDETRQESGASRPGQHGDLHSKKEPEIENAVSESTAEVSNTVQEKPAKPGASRPEQHGDLHSTKEPEIEKAVPENTPEASNTVQGQPAKPGASRPEQHGDLHSTKEPVGEKAAPEKPENTAEASKTRKPQSHIDYIHLAKATGKDVGWAYHMAKGRGLATTLSKAQSQSIYDRSNGVMPEQPAKPVGEKLSAKDIKAYHKAAADKSNLERKNRPPQVQTQQQNQNKAKPPQHDARG